MQNINGKIAFRGIAIGKIKEISKETNVVRRVKVNDVQAEIERFEAARDQAAQELKELYEWVLDMRFVHLPCRVVMLPVLFR